MFIGYIRKRWSHQTPCVRTCSTYIQLRGIGGRGRSGDDLSEVRFRSIQSYSPSIGAHSEWRHREVVQLRASWSLIAEWRGRKGEGRSQGLILHVRAVQVVILVRVLCRLVHGRSTLVSLQVSFHGCPSCSWLWPLQASDVDDPGVVLITSLRLLCCKTSEAVAVGASVVSTCTSIQGCRRRITGILKCLKNCMHQATTSFG